MLPNFDISDKKTCNSNFFYLVSIAYDGSSFSGWAFQPGIFTVQGFIEKTLSTVFQSKISILSSSRTDKGVHAVDQKFTFKLDIDFSAMKLKKILVKSLKTFVEVKTVKKVKNNFHPIYDVVLKEYRYFINTGNYNIFLKNYCWNFNQLITTSKIKKIFSIFEGNHNFFNFSYCRERNKKIKETVRKIDKISIFKKDDFIVVRILAKGFLRYQIRAIVGECVSFYQSNKDLDRLKTMLLGDVTDKYKKIAPSSGLYLWKIKFRRVNFN